MKIDITYNEKGQLKCPFISTLYNINQDVKKISEQYYLDVNNGVIIYSKNKKGIVGEHMSVINDDKNVVILKDTFGDAILEINSTALYALFQTYKKQMVSLTLLNNTDKMVVTLDTGDAVQIGRFINVSHPDNEPFQDELNKKIDFHNPVTRHKDRFTQLDDNQIDSISESIFKCMMSGIHVRLTKQLVPGISNKFNVGLFLDIERLEVKETGEEICRLYILSERKTVDHFHIYKILKY